jgi:hypothetical protein
LSSFWSRRPLLSALLLMAASIVGLAGLEARPGDGRTVAAIFPPWIGGAVAFGRMADAGGEVVRAGLLDTILVGHSEDPGFVGRLHRMGAWLVLDPVAFGGCLTRVANSNRETANDRER